MGIKMRKLILLAALLFPLPALADIDQQPGIPARYVKPFPIYFPPSDTNYQGSLAIGLAALSGQYLPAAYGNTAIGYKTLAATMTAAAVGNTAIGEKACAGVTSGANNTCIGSNAIGSAITTHSGSVYIGSLSGSQAGSNGLNSVIIAPEGISDSGFVANRDVVLGYLGGIGSADCVFIGGDIEIGGGGTGSKQTIIGINVGRTRAGVGNTANILLIGGSGNSPSLTDTATTASASTLGIGTGYPGTNDTMIGYGALFTNAQDSAKQSAFGFDALLTSNVAAAQNSAFGYQAGKLITTGKNNVLFGYNAGSATLTTGSSNIIIGSGITTPASGTASMLDIGNLIYGHLAGTAAPTISSCGTGSPAADANANDASGTVTAGGGVLGSCLVTFASAYTTWNHCRVTSQASVAAFAYSYTTAAITITGTSITGDKFDYVCDGF